MEDVSQIFSFFKKKPKKKKMNRGYVENKMNRGYVEKQPYFIMDATRENSSILLKHGMWIVRPSTKASADEQNGKYFAISFIPGTSNTSFMLSRIRSRIFSCF